MFISTHNLPGAHPVDTAWVDAALATVTADGPLGTLVGVPIAGGDGILVAGWPAAGTGRLELVDTVTGTAAGPPRFMQVVAFDGPRSPQWAAAEAFAATERLAPATREVPGVVAALRLRGADNAVTIVTLAESADAIDLAVQAILSTELLPGEDPALLTGPDRVGIYRLRHADLPVVTS